MGESNWDRLSPAIELKNVVKYYDDALILNNISFTVRQGETKIRIIEVTTDWVVERPTPWVPP